MFELYITKLKSLFRDRGNFFRSLIFPIILACCFFVTIVPAYIGDGIKNTDIAIVNECKNQNYDTLIEVFKEFEVKENNKVFNVCETDENEAMGLLNEGKICCYLLLTDDGITLNSASNGDVYASIVKTIVEKYLNVEKTTMNLIMLGVDPGSIDYDAIINSEGFVNESGEMTSRSDTALNHFYTLIAMVCLFGGFYGSKVISELQANLSTIACRVNIAPTPKSKLVVANILAAYTLLVMIDIILILFINLVLGMSFGNNMLYVIIVALLGSLCGLIFGGMLASFSKGPSESKTGIIIGITMFGCFLAGMMYVSMKFIVEQAAPILAYINPAALITDAIYSLYYYETLDRYLLNISILGIFAVVFGLITIIRLRRLQHASL